MVNRIGTVDSYRLNKGFGSSFCVGSRVRHDTTEEARETYRPKCWEYNTKVDVDSLNILNNNNYQASTHVPVHLPSG